MPVVGSGSAQLAALAVRLKTAGDKGLRVELLRGLKEGAKPLIESVAKAAEAQLPKKGGLNLQVAGQKVTASVRTGARTAGVRMTTTAPDTLQTDKGFVRHPVFAHKGARPTVMGKNGKTKLGKAPLLGFAGKQFSDLGYGGNIQARWVTQQIPAAKGWWSDTLAAGAPLVQPELLAVMEQVAADISKGGI